MKPSEVTKAKKARVWDTLYGNDVEKRVRFKFQVGDRVRISKVTRMFEKAYLLIWRKKFLLYTGEWLVKYPLGEIIDGTSYEPELQKIIKNDNIFTSSLNIVDWSVKMTYKFLSLERAQAVIVPVQKTILRLKRVRI